MRAVGVIPARYASTRFPGKPLAPIAGKPMIQHVWENTSAADRLDEVWVATDDERIAAACRAFGASVALTSAHHPTGTDRLAEVAEGLDAEIVVNVQGDEPEIAASAIDLTVRLLEENPHAVMATLATPIRSRRQLEDPSCVKVTFDSKGRALYFSRSPIPHAREGYDPLLSMDPPRFYQHIGLYAYRRDFLFQLAEMPPSPLEQVENLEQLRVLEAGHQILVGVVAEANVGIDTRADYDTFVIRASNC